MASSQNFGGDHLDRIALPLGGIGTGSISLGGRGNLRDFEVANRPAKGFQPSTAFFAVRAKKKDAEPQALVAEGPLPSWLYEGAFGSAAPNHGLPRFSEATFDTAYPFGRVHLADPEFPVAISMEAFNPFVYGDVATSSLPLAVIRHRITNPTDEPVEVSIALSLSNFIGSNGVEDLHGGNVNELRQSAGLTGLRMSASGIDSQAESAGELTFSLLTDESSISTSQRTGWADYSWGGGLLDFWDDFVADGHVDERDSTADRPIASLVGSVTVAANSDAALTFLITWAFPNRRAWRSEEYGGIDQGEYTDDLVGNACCNAYPDSWQAAIEFADRLEQLETDTLTSVIVVLGAEVPTPVTEAALANLSTLRSPTVFQTADGRFHGWEGVGDHAGSCFGTCTHVWGYEFATTLLFSEISRSFRRTQYELCTDESGLMSFRAGLPIEKSQSWKLAAADGQMACLTHLYLDWRLSGDLDELRQLWPSAKRTLEFCWVPGGWDADRDGVMEGVQHNTMDVEYYGPNSQMGSLYLAALLACSEMATALDDHDFAAECRRLFESGSSWIDQNLFNGKHYYHQVRGVESLEDIAPGLRHVSMGSADIADPMLQLAEGCLIDQLVGDYASRLVGLGGVLDQSQVKTAVNTVYDRNYKKGFQKHFNNMRSFVLGNESAVLMCTYEHDRRPVRPFPYFAEVMTGSNTQSRPSFYKWETSTAESR